MTHSAASFAHSDLLLQLDALKAVSNVSRRIQDVIEVQLKRHCFEDRAVRAEKEKFLPQTIDIVTGASKCQEAFSEFD